MLDDFEGKKICCVVRIISIYHVIYLTWFKMLDYFEGKKIGCVGRIMYIHFVFKLQKFQTE